MLSSQVYLVYETHRTMDSANKDEITDFEAVWTIIYKTQGTLHFFGNTKYLNTVHYLIWKIPQNQSAYSCLLRKWNNCTQFSCSGHSSNCNGNNLSQCCHTLGGLCLHIPAPSLAATLLGSCKKTRERQTSRKLLLQKLKGFLLLQLSKPAFHRVRRVQLSALEQE